MSSRRRKTSSELDRLAEQLERELGGSPSRPGKSGRARSSMASLVREALVPVEPSQQFVSELGRGLMLAAARSRQSLIRRYRMAIMIAAAAFGSLASIVGIVALLVRRSRMRTGLSG